MSLWDTLPIHLQDVIVERANELVFNDWLRERADYGPYDWAAYWGPTIWEVRRDPPDLSDFKQPFIYFAALDALIKHWREL